MVRLLDRTESEHAYGEEIDGNDRIAVITGADAGIGLAVTKTFMHKFYGTIYFTGIHEDRAQESARRLLSEIPREMITCKDIVVHKLDVSDPEDVVRFKKTLESEHGYLDEVLHTHESFYKEDDLTPFAEQVDNVLQQNYFGTRRLCDALFPLLRPHSRVVHVTSKLGLAGAIKNRKIWQRIVSNALTVEELDSIVQDFIKHAKLGDHAKYGYPSGPYAAYQMSKLALTKLTTIQQSQLLHKEDVLVNACCPLYQDLNLVDNRRFLLPNEGAITPVYLAMLPENSSGPKGSLLCDMKEIDWINEPCCVEDIVGEHQPDNMICLE